MSVVDASVMVDALVGAGPHGDAARRELRGLSALPVPALFSAEVVSALRALVARRALNPIRARAAMRQLSEIRLVAYPFEPLTNRVWELRHGFTVYAAWYVALAERLGDELVTADAHLAGASGARCAIRLVAT